MENWEEILSLSLSMGSIFFNMIIIFKLVEKSTTYNQIIRLIIKLECIFYYSQAFIFCIPKLDSKEHNSLFYDIVKGMSYLLRYLLFDKIVIIESAIFKLKNFILMLYFASESVLFFLNTVLCIEMVLIIKNPITHQKNRVFQYIIVSIIITAIIVLLYLVNPDEGDLKCEYVLYFSLVLLIIFIIFGAVSIGFLSIHFWKERMIMQASRKIFVIKHGLYVLIYLVCFSFNLALLIYMIINKRFFSDPNEPKHSLELVLFISLFVNSSVGIILFPIRILETTLVWVYPCIIHHFPSIGEEEVGDRQSDSLMMFITDNMNLEVICCILYGLDSIFQSKGGIDNSSNASDKFIDRQSVENITKKDFTKAKLHKIKYKKIFNHQNDPNQGLFRPKTINSAPGRSQSLLSESIRLSRIEHKSFHKIVNQHDAIIIEYCKKIFNIIRFQDDISNESIDQSLKPQNNQDFLKSLVESKGKSGSFFFFSSDNRYIIKTISSSELESINGGFLINYFHHINNSPDTLITKIYGIFTIVINEVTKIHIILMQNLVNCNSKYVKNIFDIKGSTFQRKTQFISHNNNTSPLKDLDFLWMKRVESDLVSIDNDVCDEIISRLESDTKMLMNNNLMDYSLLMVIIQLPNEEDENYLEVVGLLGDKRYYTKTFKAKNKKYIYVLGIIDYLQQFNFWKTMELKAKSVIYWKESQNVSVQPPEYYAQRLVDFVKDNLSN